MIQIRNLTYTIGDRQLIKSADWMIHPGKHMALIGPNGAGKTTLLKIIHGNLKPEAGEIISPKNTCIGYLPQEEQTLQNRTLIESVMQQQKNVTRLEQQIQDIQHQLGQNNDPVLLEKMGRLEHQYTALGGYEMEHQVKRILSGLGFRETDFRRSLSEFSGGWRMRSVLAGLLLQDPDVLLLDEPTNHLDLNSLEWLEQYLKQFRGSLVIVSHDRFFIDRLATDIYELDRGNITHYAGNYHFYEKKKEENLALLKKQWKEQQDELKRQQQFVDKFRYKATKAAQVQSRIKQMEKVERIALPEERRTWSFQITAGRPGYKHVLKIRNMSFKYEEEWILKDLNLDIYRGDRIAVVGENGEGKTTLTRLIHQDVRPQQGEVTLGQQVEIGYYSQHQIDALNLQKSIIEEVAGCSEHALPQQVRNILGIFQFSGEDVYKRIGVLSGGEKARVSLAKILLAEANFLIMDEPTNHLDIISKEALEQALQHYHGTLLLISHDRYFLTKLVHRVIALKDGHLRIYEGNYNDYLERREQEDLMARENRKTGSDTAKSAKKSKEERRRQAELRDELNRQQRPLKQKCEKLENQIDTLEAEKQTLEARMADPDTYSKNGLIANLTQDHAKVTENLEALYLAWEETHEALESMASG